MDLKVKILLIEDEEFDVRRVKNTIKPYSHFIEILSVVSDGNSAIQLIENNPGSYDVIIMDYQIAGNISGEKLIRKIKQLDPLIQIIVITKMTINLTDYEFAQKLVDAGAMWYCTKYPGDIEEFIYQPTDFLLSIMNAYEKKRLTKEKMKSEGKLKQNINKILEEKELVGRSEAIEYIKMQINNVAATDATIVIRGESGTGKELVATRVHYLSNRKFENFVYQSEKMSQIIELASQVAQTDSTVLLLGESGTGKSLLAKAIHFNSARRDGPFIVVNCPSIPENLLESELFGHVKGAFTGAIRDKKGKFELANGGTIFLDEIGDLENHLQAKLLRVLQERVIERVGDVKTIPVDVRVIAATNQNLEQLVLEKKFREDLYYRLSVFPITIPPLRERKEEIPLLVKNFIHKMGKNGYEISDEFLEMLEKYDWPGNIRELENVIERALILCKDGKLTGKCLPSHVVRKKHSAGMESFPETQMETSGLSLGVAALVAVFAGTVPVILPILILCSQLSPKS